jgi:anti-sigma factor RsiW
MSILWLRRRDLVCQEAVELLTDYLDGALSRRQRRRLEVHLAGCPNCSSYLDQMRTTIRLTGFIDVDALPPEAVDDLTQLYRRWREEP